MRKTSKRRPGLKRKRPTKIHMLASIGKPDPTVVLQLIRDHLSRKYANDRH